MVKKYLIIGHGLSGCVLALTFLRRNIPFLLIGKSLNGEASLASSGLITTVTGRKYVKSWMIDELIESALDFYTWTEKLLGDKYFFPVEIIRFLSHPEALTAWNRRLKDREYQKYISEKRYEYLDRLQRPYGILTGGYRLDATKWITDVRKYLVDHCLLEDGYISDIEDESQYSGIIYATGAVGPFVSKGLIPNKGEALIVRIADWKYPAVVKEEVFFVPLGEGLFWVGSYYQPWPEDSLPSAEGKRLLIRAIENVHQGSFKIIDHVSGIRPTVDDRRPLIGLYPRNEGKYLFNGMGTKGTSLAPYWSNKLISHLVDHTPLDRIVNPNRYEIQQSG